MAYHGVKFSTSFLGETYPNSNKIEELIFWCNSFAKKGLAPSHPEGTYGNLSIRFEKGILISCTSLNLGGKLEKSDFVYVQDCNFERFEMNVHGKKKPSSETPIHWTVYKLRPEVNAVFHGHNDDLLRLANNLDIPETEQEQDYGSPALVSEVIKMANNKFFNLKNHGFISTGKTMEEAGNLALLQLEKLSHLQGII